MSIDPIDAHPAPLIGPLGATRIDFDPRTVKLSAVLNVAAYLPGRTASARDYATVKRSATDPGQVIVPKDYGNSRYGCCVFETPANLDATVCAWTGATQITNRDVVLAGYAKFTDFDLATGKNDNGASMLDGVRWAKSIGLFDAYADVEMADNEEMDIALDLTMGVQISLALPVAWQTRKVWDTVPEHERDASWKYGSWGGHAVDVVKQDRRGFTIYTWHGYKYLTRSALASYRKRDAFAGFHHALARTADGQLTPTGRTAAAIKALLPHV